MPLKPLPFRILLVTAAIFLLLCGCERQTATLHSFKCESEKQFDYCYSELDNGLKVITLEDFSCPIAAVQVWYHVGSKNEDPQRQGFAHMFEHMMFKGTDRVGESEHFGLLNKIGSSTNGYTSFDRTVYLETVPANQVELALWLEAERMAFLNINQTHFDTERNVVEEELRLGKSKPYGTLIKKIAANIYSKHPYRWLPIGELEHLRAASVPELRDFWNRYYVPNNAALIIVGAVKHNEALKLAENYFGWIPRAQEPPRVTIQEPTPTEPKTIVIDDENAPAGGVGLIWRTVPRGHKDEIVLDMLHSILGGGNSSRLYRDLVATRLLAVEAQTETWNLEQDGVFMAGAIESPVSSNPDTLITALWENIESIQTNGITETELTKARNQMLKYFTSQNLEIESKARLLGEACLILNDLSRVNTYIDEVKAVTAADIQQAANHYLQKQTAFTVIVKQNLKGSLATEQDATALITAKREQQTPAPGRAGVHRPTSFPDQAPIQPVVKLDPTPNFKEQLLENGLKIMVVENHEVPFISVKMGFTSGAWTDPQAGTAYMAMNMLTKGTETYSESQLAQELELHAITLNGSADMDTSQINGSFLTEHADKAFSLLADIVQNPVFNADEFDKLKKQILTELSIEQQQPRYTVDKEFRKQLYGSHPYSRTVKGEPEDIKTLTPDDLKNWWRSFCNPQDATLIVAGDISFSHAIELSEKYFSNWNTIRKEIQIHLPELHNPESTSIVIVDRPGSVQSQIRIGQLGITRQDQPEYFVSRPVSNYFGWAFNSRLNEEIRVKKGLTYGAWGGYTANNYAGIFKVSTFTKTESTAETVQALLEEITKLQNVPPNHDELDDSKNYIIGSFVRNRETPQQVAEDLWLIESQQLGTDYLKRLVAKIAVTTQQDCTDLVKETLDPEKLLIVVLGDAEKIKEELTSIAPVTIVNN